MKISDRIRLEHIREALLEVESYVKGVSEADFLKSSLIRNATVRQLEIIGEAAKTVSEDVQQRNPKIPWRVLGDLRNVLIHQYFGVDFIEVYKMVREDVPELKRAMESILEGEVLE